MLTTFGFLAPTSAVIIGVVVLIIFGPGKLPELGKSIGSGIKEFRAATGENSVHEDADKKDIS